tara:strand:+ start:8296 stop:8481 length:186 start_codon:yes stop_codon:yes gene_type:complete
VVGDVFNTYLIGAGNGAIVDFEATRTIRLVKEDASQTMVDRTEGRRMAGLLLVPNMARQRA